PEPAPDFSLVEVKGCITQAPGGGWQVKNGTEPVRTRNPAASSADELAAVKGKPLGTHIFQMMDLDSISAKPVKGQSVLAKGFLMRQESGDRINLTSLQTIADVCP